MHPNFAERIFTTLAAAPPREVLRWPAARPGAAPASWTAAALLGRVAAWQHALEARGPLPLGAPVLLARPASPDTLAALLAVLGLGAVPVLPPAGAGLGRLARLVGQTGARHLVLPPAAARWLGPVLRGLGRRAVGQAAPDAPADARPMLCPVPLSQPALVSHSSGSGGGRPKVVRRSHEVLQAQHAALRQLFPPWPGQRDLPLFPNILLHNLAVGALSVVPNLGRDGLARPAAARVLAQLAAETVETLTGNVHYFEALLAALARQPATFPRVRALGVGGSPVPERLLAALGPVFPNATRYVIYGSSEAEPIAVRALAPGQAATRDPSRGYCVGRPVAGLRLRLRATAPLWLPGGEPPAAAGEILVAGPHVAHPAETDEWFATGDLGYLDPAGEMWLVGRRGAAEKRVRGLAHYQLEHWLSQQPGVRQAAARPQPHQPVFEVWTVGNAPAATLRAAAAEAFGPGRLGALHRRPHLPVDGRHFSKIRYDQLR